MSKDLATLFNEFDRGKLSRRQLLTALGVAAAVRPLAAFAGPVRRRARRHAGLRSHARQAPVRADGLEDGPAGSFLLSGRGLSKEAAYYAALMNWNVRSDDGHQAVLDIGDWGGLVIRGGYQAPPPPPASAAPPAGRAGGRGGFGGPRVPRNALFDNFCWGIEPWDAKTVEAELRKRGLTPVADNRGQDFESFHVKDPDGFDLQISNGNRKNRRQGPASGKTSAPAPFAATN